MIPDKQFPVKILYNLYVFGIVNPKRNEKEEFLKLEEVDKMKSLIINEPSIRQSKLKSGVRRYYTPSFGNFLISTSEKALLKFYNESLAQEKSEELFTDFYEEYLSMLSCSQKLKKFIDFRYTI